MSFRVASLTIVLLMVSSMMLECPSEPLEGDSDGEGASEGQPEGGGEPLDEETIMLPGNVPLEIVWIPDGTFMMGRYSGEEDSYSYEDPQHQVTISGGFWLGRYEMTKAQWTAVMGTSPWSGQDSVLDDPDSPAVYVSWSDTQAFITELNAQTGESFRLPSEGEWEYACRAGTMTRFSYGDDSGYSELSNYAWWDGNAHSAGEQYAHVVGQKLANPWGLYDMHGNVWEWCQDSLGAYPIEPVMDPTGAASGSTLILRGGGWHSDGQYCRSAYRGGGLPDIAFHNIGFRIARD